METLRRDVRAAGTGPATTHTRERKAHDHGIPRTDQSQPKQCAKEHRAAQYRTDPMEWTQARPPRRGGHPARRGPRRVRGREAGLARRLEADEPHPRRPRRARSPSPPGGSAAPPAPSRPSADAAPRTPGRDFDSEAAARVERAVDRFEDDPGAALTLLGSAAAGIDRLLESWGELAEALESGPAAWDQARYHARLMLLLGHPPRRRPVRGRPGAAGLAPAAAVQRPGAATPMPAAEAEATVAGAAAAGGRGDGPAPRACG